MTVSRTHQPPDRPWAAQTQSWRPLSLITKNHQIFRTRTSFRPFEPASPPSTRVQAAANELNLAELPETQVSEANPQVDEEPDKNLLLPVPVLSLASTKPEGTAAAELAKP